jgi:hypothetical protein
MICSVIIRSVTKIFAVKSDLIQPYVASIEIFIKFHLIFKIFFTEEWSFLSFVNLIRMFCPLKFSSK